MAYQLLRRVVPLAIVGLTMVFSLFVMSEPAAAQDGLPAFEQAVVNLVNQQRQAHGLAPLAVDARLVYAAREHNLKMIATGQFAHQVTGELPLCAGGPNNDRYDAAGYPWTACAENIAAGQTTPQEVVNAWMGSPGHRANILSPTYRHMGVDHAAGGTYGNYWTLTLGAGPANAIPMPGLQPAPQPTNPPSNPQPTVAPGADIVRIMRAVYLRSHRYVLIEATSTNASATLRVYTNTGQLLGTLGHNGGGRYSAYLYAGSQPASVIVRSSAGGSATSAVTLQ